MSEENFPEKNIVDKLDELGEALSGVPIEPGVFPPNFPGKKVADKIDELIEIVKEGGVYASKADLEQETADREAYDAQQDQKIAALNGHYYPIEPYDFGKTLDVKTPVPEDVALLNTYAMTMEAVTDPAQIIDGTVVKNLFDGVEFVWNAASQTWLDFGIGNIVTASNEHLGVVEGTADPGDGSKDGFTTVHPGGTMETLGFASLKTSVTGKVNTSDVSAAPEADKIPKYDASGRLKSGAAPAADNDVVRKTDLDDFWAVLYDESKARNLLDVLGIRAVHSDDPATAEEIASAMTILHQKINPDGIPNFSGLRLGDYLDLPTLNDGTTTYTWVGSYKNLRITIAGFNIYKHAGNIENTKNHIVFMFRNCPLTRRMNASNTNIGGYPATEMKTYLEGAFKTGLINVLGNHLYEVNRLISIKESWTSEGNTVFLPTEREVWGTSVWDEKDWGGGFQAQFPIFRDSAIWKVKRYNGARQLYWTSSPVLKNLMWDISYFFCTVDVNGNSNPSEFASNAIGVAPAFCVV